MDRATSREALNERHPSFDLQASLVLPSRDSAYDTAQAVLQTDSGVMVVTGDAGMGKSWLRRLVEREAPIGRRSLTVEISPSESRAQIDQKISRGLGLESGDHRSVAEFLDERLRNDERWTLVIEEAHHLTWELLEEVRILFESSRFSSLLLLGRTSLARRLSLPAFSGFAARISGFEHIAPIDADEAELLLNHTLGHREWPMDEVERLHRDSAGVPTVLLRLAMKVDRSRMTPIQAPALSTERPASRPEVIVHQRSEPQPHFTTPLLGPDRPPLRVEDGLIEVGWNADDDTGTDEGDESDLNSLWPEQPTTSALSIPAIDTPRTSPMNQHPELWADQGQEHAPLGPIFARNRSGDDRVG